MNAEKAVYGVIDPLRRLASVSRGSGAVFGINDVLVIEGWACVAATKSACDAVYVCIDGERAARAVINIDRADVALAINGSRSDLGFRAVITMEPFGPGVHDVSLEVVYDGSNDTIGPVPITIVDPRRAGITHEVHLDPLGQPGAAPNVRVDYGDSLRAVGWAVYAPGMLPPQVVVIIDEHYVFEADYGLDRLDVAAAFALPDIGYGFETTIDTEVVGVGSHVAVARIVSPEAIAGVESEIVRNFEITAI